MKVYILPKSTLCKLSIGLIVGLVFFYLLFFLLVTLGQRGGDTFFSNLALAIPVILAGISGISAFIIGAIVVIKIKDLSILVLFSIIIGFFVLLFVLGEILFSH